MANQEHLDILKQGVDVWNRWKKNYPNIKADLSNADLQGLDIRGVDFREANLSEAYLQRTHLNVACLIRADLRRVELYRGDLYRADLSNADLRGAHLREADLNGANLNGANLTKADFGEARLRYAHLNRTQCTETYFRAADLRGANLKEADLREADFYRADLSKANLDGADLSRTNLKWANLSEANLSGAFLIESFIYAISAWNVQLKDAKQLGLIITNENEPMITVDNMKIAQFIYLLLNNKEVRDIIDTITSKVVLILGRFTPERKAILDAIRDELRKRNYLPVLFDFEKPTSRDITETVSTLAHMARFVIADITDAKSIPQELMLIVPNLPSVPVQPLILELQHEYGMFEHFTRFPWVLPVYRYVDEESLLQSLKEKVIAPAQQKAQELKKG